MSSLQKFNFNQFQLRIVVLDNQPWFIAKDVAEALEYTQTQALIKILDEDDYQKIGSSKMAQLIEMKEFGYKDVLILNESGLYTAILGSKRPQAIKFKKWVTSEVLPSIRETGKYDKKDTVQEDTPESLLSLIPDKDIGGFLLRIGEEFKKLEDKIKADEPYVCLAKAIEKTETSISVENFAKVLFERGKVNIGRNRLYAWLRNEGYLMENNNPYQKYLESGLFEIRQVPEKTRLYFQTLITPQGQMMFVEPICNYFGTIDEPNVNVSEECKLLESQGD